MDPQYFRETYSSSFQNDLGLNHAAQLCGTVRRHQLQRVQVKPFVQPRKRGFYLVYLPAYSLEHLSAYFRAFPEIRWKIFTRHTIQKTEEGNVKAYPIDQEKFLKALKNCSGVICGAGFELPAEALYLQKKVMVVPIKGQYEQACNALSLQELGVPVLHELNPQSVASVQTWIDNKQEVAIDFSDKTSFIIDRVIIRNCLQSQLV